jgi:hypothetical protein
MRWPATAAAFVGLLVSVVAACGQGQATIPPGAQLVHLVATESAVRLSPASVHAGSVFVQLDEPLDGGSFVFVERKTAAADTPGPLTDDDLFGADRWPWLGEEALVEMLLWDTSRHYEAHLEHLAPLAQSAGS